MKVSALTSPCSVGGAHSDGGAVEVVAVAIPEKGHWIAGMTMVVTCYLLSLVLLGRLFVIVKSKLLTIPWFVKIWKAILACAHGLPRRSDGYVKGQVEARREVPPIAGCPVKWKRPAS